MSPLNRGGIRLLVGESRYDDGMKNQRGVTADSKAIRRATRENVLSALREGRKNRAVTFKNRKKEQARKACRGRHNQ